MHDARVIIDTITRGSVDGGRAIGRYLLGLSDDPVYAEFSLEAKCYQPGFDGSYAMTLPGRLRAMTNRIGATLEAVRIVRPAHERFYTSLNDEQQARFNALGPNNIGERSQRQPQQEANAQSDTCGEPKSSLTQLPIERNETVIRPAGTQKEVLDRLREATEKAVQGCKLPARTTCRSYGWRRWRSGSRPCRLPTWCSRHWMSSVPH